MLCLNLPFGQHAFSGQQFETELLPLKSVQTTQPTNDIGMHG